MFICTMNKKTDASLEKHSEKINSSKKNNKHSTLTQNNELYRRPYMSDWLWHEYTTPHNINTNRKYFLFISISTVDHFQIVLSVKHVLTYGLLHCNYRFSISIITMLIRRNEVVK